MALSAATQEGVWLSRLLTDIKAPPRTPILIIKEDNQGTIAVVRYPVSHNRAKHVDIKFHDVREALEDEIINLIYCSTEQMTANILTKSLALQQFETYKMGLKNLSSQFKWECCNSKLTLCTYIDLHNIVIIKCWYT